MMKFLMVTALAASFLITPSSRVAKAQDMCDVPPFADVNDVDTERAIAAMEGQSLRLYEEFYVRMDEVQQEINERTSSYETERVKIKTQFAEKSDEIESDCVARNELFEEMVNQPNWPKDEISSRREKMLDECFHAHVHNNMLEKSKLLTSKMSYEAELTKLKDKMEQLTSEFIRTSRKMKEKIHGMVDYQLHQEYEEEMEPLRKRIQLLRGAISIVYSSILVLLVMFSAGQSISMVAPAAKKSLSEANATPRTPIAKKVIRPAQTTPRAA